MAFKTATDESLGTRGKHIVAMLMCFTLFLITNLAAAISVPANVAYFTPITVTNNQGIGLAANVPIAVGVTTTNVIGFNAIAYQQYETCNLNNAEFFFANGTIINSWLEGSILNEMAANSVCTSASSQNALSAYANVLYWLNYPWPSSFLPANTQSTYYVPITLTNSQSSATGGNFQEMLTINSLSYQSYINANWMNVEFTDGPASGNVLDSWVESNPSNTATNTIVWVLLDNSIAANSNEIIYMDFTASNVMSSSGPTGEAPQLSSNYGQYDDGASVFDYYNVAPPFTTGWTVVGVAGQTASAPSGSHYGTTNALYANSVSGDYMYTSIPSLNTNEIISFDVYTTGLGDFFFLANSIGAGWMARLDGRGGANHSGISNTISWVTWSSPGGIAENTNTWYKYDVVLAGTSATGYIGSISNSLAMLGTQTNIFTISNNGNYLGVAGDVLGSTYITYWDGIVVRMYPPAGVMPSASFGALGQGTTSSNTVYMGWTSNVLGSQPTFSNTVTGEAPQLSCPSPINTVTCGTYAQYDNGNTVFGRSSSLQGSGFYDNFYGNTISAKWGKSGNVSVSNSVRVPNNGMAAYIQSIAAFYAQNALAEGLTLIPSGTGFPTFGWEQNTAPYGSYAIANLGNPYDFNVCEGSPCGNYGLNTGTIGTFTPMSVYANTTNAFAEVNYKGFAVSTAGFNSILSQQRVIFSSGSGTGNYILGQWSRVRLLPPNGILPATSLGAIYSMPTLTATNIVVDAGQTITFTATSGGGTQPYTYNYLIVNSVTGAVIANMLFTGVSSATNSFVFTANGNIAGNTLKVNVMVTDSASVTTNSIYTLPITVNKQFLNIGWTASNAVIDAGQTETLTATISGGANSFSTGNFNYNFARVQTSDAPQLDPSQYITIDVWANLSSLSGVDPALVMKGPINLQYEVYDGYTGSVDQGVWGEITTSGSQSFIQFTASTPLKSWNNYILTYNGAYISAYLNGVRQAVSPLTGTINSLSNPLYLGVNYGYGYSINGYLADVQLYNLSLSPAQVNSLYAEGLTGAPITFNGLVGWWYLDGNGNDYSRYQASSTSPIGYQASNATVFNDLVYSSGGSLVANNLVESQSSNAFVFSTAGWSAGVYTANTVEYDGATAYSTTSNSMTFTVNPALSTPSLSASNSLVDAGQSILFTAAVTGGTPPYTYNYLIVNSVTGTQIANMLFTGISATTNTFAFVANGNLVGNTLLANVIITDSAHTPASVNSVKDPAVTVINSITGFNEPIGVAFDPVWNIAYATNFGSPTVNVINVATNTVINTITGFSEPYGVAFAPSGGIAYVVDEGGSVKVINVATNTIANVITGFVDPRNIALNPQGTLAYVPSYSGGTVNVINLASNIVVSTITGFSDPYDIAISPQGTVGYVTNFNGNTVNVINLATNSVVNTITGFNQPWGIAINPSGTLAYVANRGGAHALSVINIATNTVVNTISGANPWEMAFNPQGTLAYIATAVSTVNIIGVSSNAIVGSIAGFSTPWSIAINAQGTIAYVADFGSTTVNVMSLYPYIPVDPALSAVSLASSNAIASQGQAEDLTYTISGGTPPYTYNFLVTNSSNGNIIASAIYANVSSTANSFMFTLPVTANDAGLVSISAKATDSASAPTNILSSNTATVNAQLRTISLSASIGNPVQNEQDPITYAISGGTAPYTFNFLILNASNGNLIAGQVYSSVSQTSNTFVLLLPSTQSDIGTLNVLANVVDSTSASTNSEIQITVGKQSSSGGGSSTTNQQSSESFTILDNAGTSIASNRTVISLYIVNSTSRSVQKQLYNQDQLPAEVSVPQSEYLNLSFACSFSINSANFSFSGSVYGLGAGYACNSNHTLYSATEYDVIYNLIQKANSTPVTPPPPPPVNSTTTSNSIPKNITTTNTTAASNTVPIANVTPPITLSANLIIPNFFGNNFTAYVNTVNGSFAKAIVSNTTGNSPPAPAGTSKLESVSIYSTTTFQRYNITLSYACGYPANEVAPYYYDNGTWTMVQKYTVNSQACTISFVSTPATEIGIFLSQENSTQQKPAAKAVQGSGNNYLLLGVVAAIAIITVIYLFARRRRH